MQDAGEGVPSPVWCFLSWIFIIPDKIIGKLTTPYSCNTLIVLESAFTLIRLEATWIPSCIKNIDRLIGLYLEYN